MRRIFHSLSFLFVLAFIGGCQKNIDKQQGLDEVGGSASANIALNDLQACGTPRIVNLTDAGGANVYATAEVSNDGNNVYIKVTNLTPGVGINALKLVYGTEAHVRASLETANNSGCFSGFTVGDYFQQFLPTVQSVTHSFPIGSVDQCFYLAVQVIFAATDANGNITGSFSAWTQGTAYAGSLPCQQYVQYCKQNCPPPPPTDCGPLRTQTPGGWGAVPHGHNPGTYLHANFAAAFPAGLKVGCATGKTITLTTAQAITNLLPTGGKAAVLTSNYTNPPSLKNVVVGHLVALTLSVGFDNTFPNFGAGGVNLGNMVIGSGAFAGKTVNEFLAIANNVLGGCSNAYSINTINEVATSINENYVDGTSNNGFLNCPVPPER